ncbi:hypothetical protein Tco_0276865 [Tanacetum coccineum]
MDPSIMKQEFLNHFSNRFAALNSPRIVLEYHFPTVLSSDQQADLENNLSRNSSPQETKKEETNMQRLSQIRRIPCQDQVQKHLKEEESNYSSFHDLRSSCNEDMVKYKGPRPSTTQARALNEKSNQKTPPANSMPPGKRLCCPALGAHVFHFTLEETWIIKKDLDPLN